MKHGRSRNEKTIVSGLTNKGEDNITNDGSKQKGRLCLEGERIIIAVWNILHLRLLLMFPRGKIWTSSWTYHAWCVGHVMKV